MEERFDCVKEYEDRDPRLDKQGEMGLTQN